MISNRKMASIILVLATVIALPFATQNAQAQSATGSATISATCGLSLNSTSFTFGTLAINQISGEDDETIAFSNAGSVNANVTSSAKNWLSGTTTHIGGELTKFSTSDLGTDGKGVAYASKNPLNATDGDVLFGIVKVSPSVNNTNWQLQATLQNLPFSGALTQAITFTASCLT